MQTQQAPAIVQQMLAALKDMGTMMLQFLKEGDQVGIEQKEIFGKCRGMISATWGVPELQAANLCRLAINEAVRAISGKDHYSPDELQIIIKRAF
jgi:hypothetical protein